MRAGQCRKLSPPAMLTCGPCYAGIASNCYGHRALVHRKSLYGLIIVLILAS